MDINEISMGRIYKPVFPTEDCECFTYIRGWKNGEVGFSVMEEYQQVPDFSNCGVFWVSQENFAQLFEVYQ